jgi:membrane protease subunit HflK
MMRRFFLLVVIVLAVSYGLTGVVQVREGERGVVRRFGRVVHPPLEPGLSIGLPYGMDRVDLVKVDRVQSVTIGFEEGDALNQPLPVGQILTGDHNLVNVEVTLQYKVDPAEVVRYLIHKDRMEGLLTRAAESAMGSWVGSRDVDTVLLDGKEQLRDYLVGEVRQILAPYELGVEVLGARVGMIAPPDDVKDAFEEVTREQTGIATAKHKASEYADQQQRLAEAEVYQIQQDTAAYATTQRLLAREEAERFLTRLAQYRTGQTYNPQYLRQIWEEERKKLFLRLKENGQIDLLDHHLGFDGLNIITAPPMPEK